MSKVKILFICCNEEILAVVLRLINKQDAWEATGAGNEEEAAALFCSKAFDLVLLGSGIEKEAEARLRALFTEYRPGVRIAEHYGGGSGLLSNEIEYALSNN